MCSARTPEGRNKRKSKEEPLHSVLLAHTRDVVGERNRQSISVRGNVVSSGSFSYDFGQSPLGWDPPSIGKRIQDLWIQGPRMFDPYPPGPCGDSLAITNARMFSVLKSRVTLYPTQAFEETYQFLFDYCYEYTCPNGPLRKILVVLFKYHYVVRDRSTGNVVAREVQNAYFVGNVAP